MQIQPTRKKRARLICGVICKFMIKYQVMLEGKNFLLNMEGSIKKYGFYTTRYLEANNPEDAK